MTGSFPEAALALRLAFALAVVPTVLAGCAAPVDSAAPRSTPAAKRPKRAEAEPVTAPSYVLLSRPVGKEAGSAALPHALVDGIRYGVGPSGIERAETVTDPPLSGAARLPAHLGGGFLFWNQRALYRAAAFVSELLPVADLGVATAGVAFGPDFLLVRTDAGNVYFDARTWQPRPPPVPSLSDVAALGDGRVVAVTATGDALISSDGGRGYTSVRALLSAPVGKLGEHEGDLLFIERTGEALRLMAGGRMVRQAAPARQARSAVKDARWPFALTPLEQAAQAGSLLEQKLALVPASGALAIVDVRSGELLEVTSALVPGARDCTLLSALPSVLMVCEGSSLSVIAGPLGSARVERTFPPGTALGFADSVLVAGASCRGDRGPGQVCVRDSAGVYRDYDLGAELAKLGEASDAGAPSMHAGIEIDWIPKRGGGALGLVKRPKPGIIDAATADFGELAPERTEALFAATTPYGGGPVLTSRLAMPEGSIVGYGRNASFRVRSDGSVVPNAFEFSGLAAAGRRALAVDRNGRYFESGDYGQSWLEIDGPPGAGAPEACSEIGCRSKQWLRLGWGPSPPRKRAATRQASAPRRLPEPPLPELVCREAGALVPQSHEIGPVLDDRAPEYAPGFGARRVLASTESAAYFRRVYGAFGSSELGLQGLLHARVPEIAGSPRTGVLPASPAELLRVQTYHYVLPFEPEARVRTATVTWKLLSDAALRVGGLLPSLQVSDEEEGQALPVLAPAPRAQDGLLLEQWGPSLWLREGATPVPVGLGQGRDELRHVSAVSPAPGALALLLEDDDGGFQVIAAGKPYGAKLPPAPGSPQALALGTQGDVAAFYGSTGVGPPSKEDPALLALADGRWLALPAWTTLAEAHRPSCAPAADDYRLVLEVPRGFVRIAGSERRPGEMRALVRVNEARFCLEALEIEDAEIELGPSYVPARIVLRFTPEPAAARVGLALGAELRQPLACELR